MNRNHSRKVVIGVCLLSVVGIAGAVFLLSHRASNRREAQICTTWAGYTIPDYGREYPPGRYVPQMSSDGSITYGWMTDWDRSSGV